MADDKKKVSKLWHSANLGPNPCTAKTNCPKCGGKCNLSKHGGLQEHVCQNDRSHKW